MIARALVLGGLLLTATAAAAQDGARVPAGGRPADKPAPASPAPVAPAPVNPQGLLPFAGDRGAQGTRPRQLPSTVTPSLDAPDSPFGDPSRRGFGQPAASAIPTLPSLPDPNADLAYGAYQRGLYRRAYDEAKARVDQNPRDAAALTLLAELTYQGLGVRQDFAKAAEWYKLAEAQGDPNAAFGLAMMMLAGRGVPKNEMAALSYLEKAAKAGQGPASYNLAVALISTGKPDDLKRAVDLLRTAAEGEIGDAQYALAVLTKQGRGVQQSDTEAAQWMARAAANDNISAQVEYAIMLFNGEGVKADEKRAARLFALAAGRGNAIAQNRYARLLLMGRGVPKSRVEAASWNLMAAQQGLTDRWLDDALKDLSSAERMKAEGLARQRNADLSANLQP
ncbi:tetratricopeptide repeat protein [Chelatococcus asaccharovorans]|uniref:tetratricopeptide repeat protein n=1 Tax=Chelatococcus asaccharovorans TaxID=28210 RepID=UPI00224C723B|nr:tetratricopeptide repeat protein [Chelatococcus asaccharovorans]CAH1654409.1 conserved exported hypothetical protein [Chelatococcus asaccharovorans]CAH1685755.1 conserved exported hypothetical protein [Chelatococcus asaccharovorans]